jgi:hypothetical protein
MLMEYIAHDSLVQVAFLGAFVVLTLGIYVTRSDRRKKAEGHEQEVDTMRVREELKSLNLPAIRDVDGM